MEDQKKGDIKRMKDNWRGERTRDIPHLIHKRSKCERKGKWIGDRGEKGFGPPLPSNSTVWDAEAPQRESRSTPEEGEETKRKKMVKSTVSLRVAISFATG